MLMMRAEVSSWSVLRKITCSYTYQFLCMSNIQDENLFKKAL